MSVLFLHNETMQRDASQDERARPQHVIKLPRWDERVILIADVELSEFVMGEVKERAAEV